MNILHNLWSSTKSLGHFLRQHKQKTDTQTRKNNIPGPVNQTNRIKMFEV